MSTKKINVKSLLTAKVNEFTTIAACREFASCKFGYGFVARSTPRFVAPKDTAALWLATFGTEMPEVVKVTKVTNARSGNYGKKLEKAGAVDYEVEAPKGYDWVVPNVIKRAQKDGSLQLCVTFTRGDKTTFESFYIVGDHFATPQELEFIKTWLYVAPPSKKQAAAGVAPADEVLVRNYKFCNVACAGTTPEVESYWKQLV